VREIAQSFFIRVGAALHKSCHTSESSGALELARNIRRISFDILAYHAKGHAMSKFNATLNDLHHKRIYPETDVERYSFATQRSHAFISKFTENQSLSWKIWAVNGLPPIRPKRFLDALKIGDGGGKDQINL